MSREKRKLYSFFRDSGDLEGCWNEGEDSFEVIISEAKSKTYVEISRTVVEEIIDAAGEGEEPIVEHGEHADAG